jgi:hypothetical protein
MTDEAMSPLRRPHDRRHEHAQVSAEDAEGLHPNHQELGCVYWAIAGYRELRGHMTFSPAF